MLLAEPSPALHELHLFVYVFFVLFWFYSSFLREAPSLNVALLLA